MEETVTITKKEYEELKDSQLFLSALESSGVDNWTWYDEAQKQYREWKGETNDDA